MSARPLPEPQDDNDRAILGHIASHGWSVIGIPEDDEGPTYSFSVGMYHTLGHPEVVVMGQKLPTAHGIINHVGGLIRAGRRFAPGDRADGVLDGYPVAVVAVDRRYYREYLGYAGWLYRGDDFPVVQCVWPDKAGAFPWDENYPAALFRQQRVLGPTDRWPHGWPFPDPPNVATFTTRQVVRDGKPILHVSHDADDGAWQFHTGRRVSSKDGMIVALEAMLALDPTLADLGNLPCGWRATRKSASGPWEKVEG